MSAADFCSAYRTKGPPHRTALLAATALALAALGLAASPTAPAAECSWARHSQRVVKKVHRHGKLRRVVRVRHTWRCDPVAAAPPAAVLSAPLPIAEPPLPRDPHRVLVQAANFFYSLSQHSLDAGEETIELANRGEDAHNLNLQREGGAGEPILEFPETPSFSNATRQFDLDAGTYKLWCSLPEHEGKGMHTTLVVE